MLEETAVSPLSQADGAKTAGVYRPWIACLLAIGLFLLLVGAQARTILRSNHGTFVYSLDDAYIHLAIANNLALHGNWGLTAHTFAGASSSPGWTSLLSLTFRIFGNHLLIPLLLNILFGVLLMVFATRTFIRWKADASPVFIFCSLAAMAVLTPMPGLTLIGMEGILQSLLATILAVLSVEVLETEATWGVYVAWLLAAFAAAAVRYETVFFVVAFAVYALFRRRLRLILMLGIASGLPPALYAIYAVRHGGYALPYSVIVKAHQAHAGHTSIVTAGSNLIGSPATPIFLIAAVTFASRFKARRLASRTQVLLLLFMGTCLLHMLAGPAGWLMRYEAYLFAVGVTAVGLAIADEFASSARGALPAGIRTVRQLAAANIALFLALIPTFRDLVARAHHGYVMPVLSAHDRYVEHLSPALFVREFYKNQSIVANDIGFISYYGHSTVLDPLGLGSIEPVRLLKEGKVLGPQEMQAWARSSNAEIAILQTDYPNIHHLVPSSWILVETWCYPRNVVFRDHTISFFSTTQENAERLRANLGAFTPVSSEVVRQTYADGSERSVERPLSEYATCEANSYQQVARK